MATQVNRRRGTQAQHAAFTGAVGETTYDTDRKTVVAHDGLTVGGFVVAAPHLANTFSRVQTITPPVNESALIISGVSLTGAAANSALDISGTWNTAGDPAGIKLNITNTASGASALLFDLQKDTLSRFQVRKSGFVAVLRQEADVSASSFELTKRGTTGNALAALSNGSAVGAMLFRGYDGTAFGDAGSVRTFTTQAWVAGAHGTSLNFNTIPIGGTAEATHATLTSTELSVTSRLLLPNTTSATVGGVYFGGSRAFHNFGTNNTFVGVNAGNFTMTGTKNAAFGTNSGAAITTGTNNCFFGYGVGAATTTGGSNSFFGVNAGATNSTGINNSFFGNAAGLANSTGVSNSFFGFSAGQTNSTGTNNSFFGFQAGLANLTGNGNSFFGLSAGTTNSTGLYNSFFGFKAGLANSTGVYNSFFGAIAGQTNSTGGSNSFFGLAAGYLNSTGGSNSFFGTSAGRINSTGANNSFFGFQAGNNVTTGSNNIVIGYDIDSPTATNSNTLTIGNLIFGAGINGTGTTISTGGIGIAVITPTARFHLPAGTTTASTAPLKFNTGTSMTAAEAGAVEFTTDDLFFTITTGAARKRLLLADPTAGLTSTRVPFATTNGRLTDAAGFTFAGTTLTLANLTMSTAGVLSISSGANQRAGNATLVGGTVTVANTTVTANTVVMLTRKTSGGTIGTAITYTVIAATSFTITSDSVLDTSTFSYMLIEVP